MDGNALHTIISSIQDFVVFQSPTDERKAELVAIAAVYGMGVRHLAYYTIISHPSYKPV